MFFSKKKVVSEKEIAFFWMEDNFIVYAWPDYINSFPYTLSIFEMEEKSFDSEVVNVFHKIADILTKEMMVKHLPAKDCSESFYTGVKEELFQQQFDTYDGWDETELFCYSGNGEFKKECDLYFMIDVLHANMTIKCYDRNLFEKAKVYANEIIRDRDYRFEKWQSDDND
ncbi:hypothetical protein [Anaerotignum sp.]